MEKLEPKFEKTARGFANILFQDGYGQKCSAQKSSKADSDYIWLGVNTTGPLVRGPTGGYDESVWARMHLNTEQALELAQILIYFAEHGDLPEGPVVTED